MNHDLPNTRGRDPFNLLLLPNEIFAAVMFYIPSTDFANLLNLKDLALRLKLYYSPIDLEFPAIKGFRDIRGCNARIYFTIHNTPACITNTYMNRWMALQKFPFPPTLTRLCVEILSHANNNIHVFDSLKCLKTLHIELHQQWLPIIPPTVTDFSLDIGKYDSIIHGILTKFALDLRSLSINAPIMSNFDFSHYENLKQFSSNRTNINYKLPNNIENIHMPYISYEISPSTMDAGNYPKLITFHGYSIINCRYLKSISCFCIDKIPDTIQYINLVGHFSMNTLKCSLKLVHPANRKLFPKDIFTLLKNFLEKIKIFKFYGGDKTVMDIISELKNVEIIGFNGRNIEGDCSIFTLFPKLSILKTKNMKIPIKKLREYMPKNCEIIEN